MSRKPDTTGTESVPSLRRRIGELERWFQGQDRQIRFLERERQKLSALVNNTDAGFLVFDSDLSAIWLSNVCRAWFDESRSNPSPGRPKCHDLLCRSEEVCAECPVALALRTATVSHRELDLEIEESVRHLYVTALPIKTMENHADECILMLQDITDLEVMRRSQEALLRAKETAESANRAKSEFLANMSHEVRTPMTGILSMSTHLMDTALSPEQRECVSIIKSSGESLLTVINDILDFSRIEAGRLLIEPDPFDPTATVEEVATLVSDKAAEKNLEMLVRYAPTVPRRVVGDGVRIRQALMNLVANAVKFTHEGHVLVGVEELHASEGNSRLRFSVEDTGIGIPSDKLASVFDKFTQVDGSITRRYGGTGLGLSISKQLVELMEGEISVTSTESGSIFSFALTLPRSGAPSLSEQRLEGSRVLVLHGRERIREILVGQLESWKAEARGVGRGHEAITTLRAAQTAGAPFDLAIVADGTADANAESLAASIRQDPDLEAVRLVLLSPLGQLGEANQLKNAGYDACLARLTRPSVLLETLVRLSQRPKVAARHGID